MEQAFKSKAPVSKAHLILFQAKRKNTRWFIDYTNFHTIFYSNTIFFRLYKFSYILKVVWTILWLKLHSTSSISSEIFGKIKINRVVSSESKSSLEPIFSIPQLTLICRKTEDLLTLTVLLHKLSFETSLIISDLHYWPTQVCCYFLSHL